MSGYFQKYKKSSSYLLLSVYTFLLALTVFHYHRIDARGRDYQIQSHSDRDSSIPIDELIGLDSECIVTHFASTISSTDYFPEIFYNGNEYKTYTFLDNTDTIFFVILSKDNPLRAPPSVFFS
jgi:hypothetical protein